MGRGQGVEGERRGGGGGEGGRGAAAALECKLVLSGESKGRSLAFFYCPLECKQMAPEEIRL